VAERELSVPPATTLGAKHDQRVIPHDAALQRVYVVLNPSTSALKCNKLEP
jgi:hypothetical protein